MHNASDDMLFRAITPCRSAKLVLVDLCVPVLVFAQIIALVFNFSAVNAQ